MLRRVSILVLVSTLYGAGVTICPRPASSCMMALQARHACCDHAALRMSQCCCAAGQRTVQLVSTTGPLQPQHSSEALVAVPGWQVHVVEATAPAVDQLMRAGYGPAPPHTPIRNHLQLLL